MTYWSFKSLRSKAAPYYNSNVLCLLMVQDIADSGYIYITTVHPYCSAIVLQCDAIESVFGKKIALAFLWHWTWCVYECVAYTLCWLRCPCAQCLVIKQCYVIMCIYTIMFVCTHVCSLTVNGACNALHIWVSNGTMKTTFLKISSGYKSIK